MKRRCLNPKNKNYKNYGGRGISVCDRWLVFASFLEDMGERPPNLQLDRINNDGNYEPNNCHWTSASDNSNNKRSSRHVEYKGRSMTIAQWAEELGMSRQTLRNRLEVGWSLDKIFSTKVDRGNRWLK